MRQALTPHPEFPPDADLHVSVELARLHTLTLRYVVTGDIAALRLPPMSTPQRADGLWQNTCFEAFLRAPANSAYYEFNFAPSTQWAAYRFDGYRSGMSAAGEIDAPRIEVQANGVGFELRVALDLARLPDLPSASPWQLGLSAVIEEKTGRKSYWALAHPQGAPDFHHSDCFALEVPTALAP